MDLKQARLIAGLTQPELADRVGVDVSYICLLETGKRDINTAGYAFVMRLSLALGVMPHQIGAFNRAPTAKRRAAPKTRRQSA
jgi:transcriptional regulator with XRE-family HTH domain